MKTLAHKSSRISRIKLDYLFDHILDGYKSSHEGIIQMKQRGMVTDAELIDLLTKNGERLIQRIMEYKMVQRLVALFFAGVFGFLQITCNDLDMRRSRGGVRVRRRTEQVQPLEK